MRERPIAIFGGTFDPPHIGHLIVASDVCDLLGLQRILFVPAAVSPHKLNGRSTPGELRLQMVEIAVANDERFDVSSIEVVRGGPSFTVDTVRELKSACCDEVFVVVGADAVAEISTWREYEAILAEARIVAISRPGYDVRKGRFPDIKAVRYLEVTPVGVSSTMIRDRVAARRPIKYLVPGEVERFIYEEGLYGERGK